ncbi:protein kri1 [Actinidia eriantha]|uniref:protein kri1 n=1 Tax=Actinidia eriantha TaxID=165200 RepID=UPI00258E4E50|nr:protein kri1 [Actinidia eriantha]XP_057504914.1 protein kri1 [Actinidia eriantha]
MGMKLFDGSEDSEEELSKIEINKDFARRYEHNKKREDLQKLEELKKKGVVEDSDSDSEDESSLEEALEGEFIDSKKDLEFLNALIKVKNQDPELKNEEAKLFESENEEEGEESGEEGGKIEKKERPMYLKDVAARHLIEEGPEFEEKEEKVKSYSEEQEEFRRAFLDVAEEAFDEDDGELLKERERKNNGNEDEDEEEEEEDGDAVEVGKKLDEYFGKDDNLDENEMFLKEYFRNRMWVAEARGKALDEEVLGFSEDEEEIEKQEDYERGFNFRFEENKGDRVLGHSRVVEGSVRKKTNARKVQRKSKEERLAQAEFERKEELKHLKNLKKKEMKEKLNKIRDTAGLGENWVCPLDEDDLEEEFDPEEYDRKMKEAFNDDYYDADDADPEFGSDRDEGGDELEKPNFDKEDELLGLPKGWDDVPGSGDGFLAARERNLKRRAENGGDHEDVKEAEEKVNEEGKQKKKQKMSKLKKEVLDKELEEYYKLDYEDTIGDIKTRFKYKEVGAKTYGLSAEEILMLDDKELNQYVSIKKLAPYREKEWKVSRNMRYNQKQRNKELLQERSNGGKKSSKIDYKKSTKAGVSSENVKAQLEKSNGDISNPSRRSRRRHRLAELKLSQSRLMAYGKIPSKSKSKKKH